MSAAQDQLGEEEPPEGVFHYETLHEVPDHIKTYWRNRRSIFSKFDEGIWMTDDAWFGVTAEPIAQKIADHIAQAAPKKKTVLVDAFAGAGGNTIAFALSGRWERIFAIERDPQVLQCAKHNAKLYGVEKKIWWIEGDCFDILKQRLKSIGSEAIIFASPPWGGPTYRGDRVFDLSTMQPYNIYDLYSAYVKVTRDIVLFLPRTSNLNQVAKHHESETNKLQVVHYCIKGASKALCAYFGDFESI